eukprot:Hpha_TRINITY_DN33847_c0_g1::TRINITY_DN33847_c0_g1_i1::g.27312::m.27312
MVAYPGALDLRADYNAVIRWIRTAEDWVASLPQDRRPPGFSGISTWAVLKSMDVAARRARVEDLQAFASTILGPELLVTGTLPSDEDPAPSEVPAAWKGEWTARDLAG